MRFNRQFRYIYLRLIRFRGHPHELALGMSIGIFIGMTPTIPFHTIVAIALALALKASKITAVLGTWICNPLTVYLVYKYSYKIGSIILGFDHNTKFLSPVVDAINHGEFLHIITTILGGGVMVVAAFLLGGIALGLLCAVPSYGISLYFFKAFISWRKSRKLIKA
jgi:uncharacterized protein (DUF2062 family)